MRPTMAYSLFKRSLFLVLHTKDNPTDAEWAEYLKFVQANIDKIQSTMILTQGGGPNATQRGEMTDLIEANHLKLVVSVVTLSRMVRGIVTALSWFNPNIKAFSTIQIPAAMEYLKVAKPDQNALMAEIDRLKATLGIVDLT